MPVELQLMVHDSVSAIRRALKQLEERAPVALVVRLSIEDGKVHLQLLDANRKASREWWTDTVPSSETLEQLVEAAKRLTPKRSLQGKHVVIECSKAVVFKTVKMVMLSLASSGNPDFDFVVVP